MMYDYGLHSGQAHFEEYESRVAAGECAGRDIGRSVS